MKKNRLLIISHTEHYLRDGQVVGWGPTVREINHLLDIFDSITHIAVLYNEEAPPSALPYTSDRIRFVSLKPFGGPSIRDKLGVIQQMPETLSIVQSELKRADLFQFRVPTGIGVYLIPWLQHYARIPGWFKYAGNWMHPQAPVGYRIQKYWLVNSSRYTITINGRWPNQPPHCLSFENPCLDEAERRRGLTTIKEKSYEEGLNICFVGSLVKAKGIHLFLESLQYLNPGIIKRVHVVGEGNLYESCKNQAAKIPFEVNIHGSLSREDVGVIMENCHLIVLPSTSEGFPKVIAEASNYGCIPLVTDISSIGQYIRHGENGFLLAPNQLSSAFIARAIEKVAGNSDLKKIAYAAYKMAEQFTFSRYLKRVNEICSIGNEF